MIPLLGLWLLHRKILIIIKCTLGLQVADLIVELGPSGIDILTHVKIELLESIQEVGHMELPTGWFGNSISELSNILMKAWSNEQGIGLQRT